MFGIVKFVVWTSCAVGLGIFLASYEVDGKTPVEHAQKLFKQQKVPGKLDQVKEGVEGAIEDARKHVGSKAAPTEHHSESDKNAIDALLAKRASSK